MTTPNPRAPVQPKVKWAAVGAYVGGLVLVTILEAAPDTNLVEGLPPYISIFLGPAIPLLISFISGYVKKNKPA